MKCNNINIHNALSASYRFDPSYHLSDAISFRYLQQKLPYEKVPIRNVVERVFLGNIFSRIFVKDKEYGVPYLAASDTVLANLDTNRYLSKKQSQELSYLKLHKGWILITCSGTIGNVVFTNSEFEDRIATHDLIRVIPDDSKMLKGVLYAYLASKFGYCQLTQSRFGGVVKHINAEHVYDITIPLFPKDLQIKINDLIQESSKLREEASDKLKEAQNLILHELCVNISKRNFGKVSISSIIQSHNSRFDANFHISEGADIERYLWSHYKCKPLGNLCTSISRPNIFKRYYVNHGITFLGGADIFLATPNSDKQLSKKKTENINDLLIEEGTILLPRSGTIGNVAWVHAGHAQKLASEHVIRLKPNDILRGGYLFAFLSTSIGRSLIQKHIFGSVIQHVEPPHLNLIPIPILDDRIIAHAHENVITYSKCMGEAIKKESQAIALVEQEIESWNKK